MKFICTAFSLLAFSAPALAQTAPGDLGAYCIYDSLGQLQSTSFAVEASSAGGIILDEVYHNYDGYSDTFYYFTPVTQSVDVQSNTACRDVIRVE